VGIMYFGILRLPVYGNFIAVYFSYESIQI